MKFSQVDITQKKNSVDWKKNVNTLTSFRQKGRKITTEMKVLYKKRQKIHVFNLSTSAWVDTHRHLHSVGSPPADQSLPPLLRSHVGCCVFAAVYTWRQAWVGWGGMVGGGGSSQRRGFLHKHAQLPVMPQTSTSWLRATVVDFCHKPESIFCHFLFMQSGVCQDGQHHANEGGLFRFWNGCLMEWNDYTRRWKVSPCHVLIAPLLKSQYCDVIKGSYVSQWDIGSFQKFQKREASELTGWLLTKG